MINYAILKDSPFGGCLLLWQKNFLPLSANAPPIRIVGEATLLTRPDGRKRS